MIYMRNITITTAKSATYLENVGLNQRLLGLADGLFDRVNLLGDIKAGSARLNHFDDPLEMAVGALQAGEERVDDRGVGLGCRGPPGGASSGAGRLRFL